LTVLVVEWCVASFWEVDPTDPRVRYFMFWNNVCIITWRACYGPGHSRKSCCGNISNISNTILKKLGKITIHYLPTTTGLRKKMFPNQIQSIFYFSILLYFLGNNVFLFTGLLETLLENYIF
jgi:hypothetical protein